MPNDKSAVCECGHARSEHLRGVGCCVETYDDGESCECGVFRGEDGVPPQEWAISVATADGAGSFRVRATPEAPPELRAALFALAEEAYRLLAPFRATKEQSHAAEAWGEPEPTK